MNAACLLSGGVDSSVALYLLKELGWNVTPFYLKVWMEDDFQFGNCPWETDVEFVRKVSSYFSLKPEIVPMQREYYERVVDYTIKELKAGRTPNPDIMCNRLIKFGAFHDHYGKNFDKIASGHYARLECDASGRYHLKTTPDAVKDQTYFLSQMYYDQLSKSLFPLGDYAKKDVRAIAKKINLPNASRKDSQGICFLGKINFRDFIKRYLGEKQGRIIEKMTGKELGTHKGYWFYTLGQRTGLALGGGPWFVVDKDLEQNIIYVSNGYDPEENYRNELTILNCNWINEPSEGFANQSSKLRETTEKSSASKDGSSPFQFKIRHSPLFYRGVLQKEKGGNFLISPQQKLAGVAAGQFAAVYHQDECLGGGVIA